MAIIEGVKALDYVSPATGTPFCVIAAPSVTTGGLDYVSPVGFPCYFMEGEEAPPEPPTSALSRTYPGWMSERAYPPIPAARTFPL